MSENQSSPPAPDPPAISPNYLQDTYTVDESIEKREMLSPVSPRPVHVAEPDDNLVLRNQMDPVFNSTDTHTNPHQPIPDFNSLGFGGSHPHTLGSSTSWIEQQQSHSQQQQNMPMSSTSATNNTNGSIPSSLPSSSSSLAADPIVRNALPSAINFGNGNVPDAINGTNGVMMNKDSSSLAAADSTSVTPPRAHVYSLPNSLTNNVDLQALLTKLSPSMTQQTVSPQSSQVTSATVPAAATVTAPAAAPPAPAPAHVSSPSQARVPSLPKPPTQAQVPNQPPAQNHQTTHPLPQPPATSAVNGTSGHSSHPAGYPASLPPPPNFNQHRQQVPDSPTGTEENEEDNRPFTAEEEEAYDRFLSDERDYVTQGQWDRFPAGSRLFIGNLPTEKVTKRDLFRTFHKHGRLAQVSIKQAYGFVQFLDTASCASALRFEQGASVRGRKMHLEVSKPQRNTRPPPSDSNPSRGANRRSRSPDYGRSMSPRGRGGSTFRGGRNSGDFTDRGFTRGGRDARDHEYPARRSSPPPRYRARDDYRPHHRDRTRSPPGRYRQRTRSPPVVEELPRRDPKEVPEVQALVMDEVDRNFIWWIEKSFRDRGLSFDSVFLNPRIPLEPLVKQQILEGVQAIVFLSRQMQGSSKISIQVFDRRGDGEATYDQYDDLDPSIAAEIVYRAKLAHAPQPPMQVPTYGGYGIPQQQQQQQPQQPQQQPMLQQAAIPNLANVLGALDPATLKTLLANLQQQQQPQQPQQMQPQIHQQHQQHHQQQPHMLQAQQPQLGQDLAALLSLPLQQQQQQQQPQQNHSLNNNSNPYGVQPNPGYGPNAGLAALLGQVQQGNVQVPQQGQSPAQMQAIMDELVRWQPNKPQN